MLIVALISVQIVIFLALLFFFRRILNQNVMQATRHLDELNQDYTKKEKDANRLLSEARDKSQKMVEDAQAQAQQIKEQTIKGAETERDSLIKGAHTQSEEIIQQADRSRQALIAELNERIAKAAINKACELMQSTLPEQFKEKIHSYWIEDLIKSSFNELKNLQVTEELNEAKVISAFSLSEQQRENITKNLEQVMGRDLLLKEEVDPKIIAGVIVIIGSLVLDGSLKNKIQQQAQKVDN